MLLPVFAGGGGEERPNIQVLEEKLEKASGSEKLGLLLELADLYWRVEPDKSYSYAREAGKLAEEYDRPGDLFKALNKIGSWYYINDQYEDAVKHYLDALALEPYIDEKRLIANILVNIGMVYWRLKDPKLSEHYHTRALELRKTTDYTVREMAVTLNNLGLALYEQGRYTEALNHHLDALEFFKKIGDKRQIAAALTNINNVYTELENYTAALEYSRQALAVYKEVGYGWGEANINAGIGRLYMLMGYDGSALPYLESALEMAREIDSQLILEQVYQDLSRIFEKKGNDKLALDYYDKFMDTKELLREERTKKQSAVMATVYETGKKSAELALLRKAGERDFLFRYFLLVAGLLSLALVLVFFLRHRTVKRLNRRLALNEIRYRTLFSQAGDAIFLVDRGTFTDCNKKALDMFGMNRGQIIGNDISVFSPAIQPDGRQSMEAGKEYYQKAMSGEPLRFYWKCTDKDGFLFDATVSLTPVTLENRTLVQAIVHDISDRKRLEDERVRSAKLETAGLLADSLARTFNTHLHIMRENLDAAGKGLKSGDPLLKFVNQVENAVSSAEELNAKFVTLAEGGFFPKKNVTVNRLIREAGEAASAESGATVECRYEIAADLWPVTGDEPQIRQLIRVVVLNAAQAVKDGGDIRVTAVNLEIDAGRFISIEVVDNGTGIPPDILPHIFDPYYTTRGEVTQKGLGMGLAIAQSIVKRHNGAIDVSSRPGEGAACRFTLQAAPVGGTA
jgi:PAS domain S-box-containing protein